MTSRSIYPELFLRARDTVPRDAVYSVVAGTAADRRSCGASQPAARELAAARAIRRTYRGEGSITFGRRRARRTDRRDRFGRWQRVEVRVADHAPANRLPAAATRRGRGAASGVARRSRADGRSPKPRWRRLRRRRSGAATLGVARRSWARARPTRPHTTRPRAGRATSREPGGAASSCRARRQPSPPARERADANWRCGRAGSRTAKAISWRRRPRRRRRAASPRTEPRLPAARPALERERRST